MPTASSCRKGLHDLSLPGAYIVRKHHRQCRECSNASARVRYLQDPGPKTTSNNVYRASHLEEQRERARRWNAANKPRLLARQKAYKKTPKGMLTEARAYVRSRIRHNETRIAELERDLSSAFA